MTVDNKQLFQCPQLADAVRSLLEDGDAADVTQIELIVSEPEPLAAVQA